MIYIIKYLCLFLGMFMLWDIAHDLYQQHIDAILLLKQFGVLFICIDLWVFFSKVKEASKMRLRDYFIQHQLELPPIVKLANRLGHVGFMLIVCSWLITFTT